MPRAVQRGKHIGRQPATVRAGGGGHAVLMGKHLMAAHRRPVKAGPPFRRGARGGREGRGGEALRGEKMC